MIITYAWTELEQEASVAREAALRLLPDTAAARVAALDRIIAQCGGRNSAPRQALDLFAVRERIAARREAARTVPAAARVLRTPTPTLDETT